MPRSYRSPRTEIRDSPIHGKGLFAARAIRKGDVVAIKGGHILHRRQPKRVQSRTAFSFVQIDDEFFIGARAESEVRRNKIFLNHSCEPNVGIRGQITFVALRDVPAGAELTYDWAMEENDRIRTRCHCAARSCRKILTGQDWKLPALQRRYRGYFSAYLTEKINRRV